MPLRCRTKGRDGPTHDRRRKRLFPTVGDEPVSNSIRHLMGASPTGEIAMTEPWSSVDEIGNHLGVVKDSIYRGFEQRGLPPHKIGRLWKFNLTEVDDKSRGTHAAVPPRQIIRAWSPLSTPFETTGATR